MNASPADAIVARLSNVRRSQHGWRADCPVGHRSSEALAISEWTDGRVLLHCHAGCSAADVLATLGLTLSDLFPERLSDESPEARRAARAQFRQAAWLAALGIVDRESLIVTVAAESMLRGQSLTREDVDRLQVAASRLHDTREVLSHG